MGIDLSSKEERSMPSAIKRIKDAAKRSAKVKKLGLKAPRKRLYLTAVVPKMAYAVAVTGVAPSILQKWEGRQLLMQLKS